MKPRAKFTAGTVTALCSFVLFVGCGTKEKLKCDQLSADQSGSLSTALTDFPQHLVIDERFTASQQNEVGAAAKVWNELGNKLIGKSVFDVTVGEVASMGQTDGCGFPNVPHGLIPVIREDDMKHWSKLQLSPANLAVTRRCTTENRVEQQGVLINTKLVHDNQFMSIALHEMGHTVGLEHSCAGSGEATNSGYISCKGLTENHPYVEAVMFPTLAVYETKEDLRGNDMLRAGCVLKN